MGMTVSVGDAPVAHQPIGRIPLRVVTAVVKMVLTMVEPRGKYIILLKFIYS
jgi:hypothetical protein